MAKKNLTEIIKKFEELKKSQEIVKGVVKIVKFDADLNTNVLILDLDGIKGVISHEDVDNHLEIKSLVKFVGREVNFIVKDVDKKEKTVICSRKLAQEKTEEDVRNRLQDGETFQGQVVNILQHGAYIEIDGVTGLLKNTDFAEDYTSIKDMLKVGDKLAVKMKKTSDRGTILFEAVNKYQSPTIMKFDEFEKEQVVLGVVRSVKPFGVFVQIAPKIDALCTPPSIGEIEEDMKVRVKITDVIKDKQRIRGKIVDFI